MKKILALTILTLFVAAPAEAQRRPANQAPQEMANCDGMDAQQARSCHQGNMKLAQRQLQQAITEACRKQGATRDRMVPCRINMIMQATNGIRGGGGSAPPSGGAGAPPPQQQQ